MKLGYKETHNTIVLKEVENYSQFLKDNITEKISETRHPTLPDVVLLYHQRMPGEPKDENFKLYNANKILYGTVIFVQVNSDNKIIDMTNERYTEILKSFRNFVVTITKEYIKG